MIIKSLVKRHLLIYVRDRWAVFFSFLSVIIILGLFMLFLQHAFGGEFAEQPHADYLTHSWIISGVLMVSSVTVPLGFLGMMVLDLENKRINDFYVAPLKRYTIVFSYLLAAFSIGMVFSLINLIIGQLYLYLRFGFLLAPLTWLSLIGLVALSNLLFSSLFFYAVTFIKTSNAHSTLSTLVGTLIGFLAGLYVPIGNLQTAIRNVLSALPTMQVISAIRIVYLEDALTRVFGDQVDFRSFYESLLGVQLRFSDTVVPFWLTLLMIIGWIVLFMTLSIRRLTYFKKQ